MIWMKKCNPIPRSIDITVFLKFEGNLPKQSLVPVIHIKMANRLLENATPKPHFVLVPFMAQGHMIPVIDMAHLLANRGATVTLVTTPQNASRISTIIDRVEHSGLPIRFLPLRFPSTEFGLPEGCENVDTLPSRDLSKNFLDAARTLRDPLLLHLQANSPAPSCIITDNLHPWTREVAREFGIPRLVFHGMGCFSLLCIHNIQTHKIHESVSDENKPFVLPGLPHQIEITRTQAPGFMNAVNMVKFREEQREAELMADGVVVNSFDDLELPYKEWFEKAVGKKVWTIGPMSLYHRDVADMAARGNKASISEDQCLMWLDSMKSSSVIYVSFGSLAHTVPLQIIEIGLGLEASNCPFIWAIKAGERSSEVEEWLSAGFEERASTRGLIIRGWAPQAMILSHPSVGGFMTHCGWNSTVESVTAGVPMITWPHFAEQFLNEKLIVEVLKIGVSMGVREPNMWSAEKNVIMKTRDDVEKAVRSLMDESFDADKRRNRTRDLGEKARKAMEEEGSSHMNLTQLIKQVEESNRIG